MEDDALLKFFGDFLSLLYLLITSNFHMSKWVIVYTFF